MSLDKLWAPWRIEYITNPKEKDCFFCKYSKENNDKKRLIISRGKSAFVIMNFYPYTNGHLMVAPYEHTSEFSDLGNDTNLEMINLVQESIRVLKKVMNPQGFNIGLNLGEVSGAGIKDHLHFHIVPRWSGDTNFMPVIAHTKVIVEGLQETWEKLRSEFNN